MGSQFEGLARVPVVSGLVEDVRVQFPSEPLLGVEKAVADGLVRALDDESLDLYEVMCSRDYSPLCPEGWADTGDGNTCTASWTHQNNCGSKLKMGGLTPTQKRQQAAKCSTSYACSGSCTQDLSKSCPLGWHGDVDHDCLAPVGYSGRCVGRKSFVDMKKSEKELWAKTCDVTWPCHRKHEDALEIERMQGEGMFNNDCEHDYSKACPERHILDGNLCRAPAGFTGRCGLSFSSKYSLLEKITYANTCLTKWPCVGAFSADALK